MTQQAREKEKQRLYELIAQSYTSNRSKWEVELFEDFMLQKEIPKLVDDLLDGGVIVPPCKVGDAVYVIVNGKIREIVVDVISWTGFLFTFNDDRVYVDERQAYYTREAAEQALKERDQHE